MRIAAFGVVATGALSSCGSAPTEPLADVDCVLAFVSDRDGNDEIYCVGENGALVNLTNDPADDRGPVWSPDGRRIAFTRQTGPQREVLVLDLRSRSVTDVSLSPADDYDPAWSPDGRRIAFTSARDGNEEIYVVNGDGGGLDNLTRNPAPDTDPAWSPDGTHIAFTSGRDLRAAIYVIDPDGSNAVRLTPGSAWDDYAPEWHWGGDLIAFESNRDGASDIRVISLTTGIERGVAPSDAHETAAQWAPEGEKIVFLSNRDDILWDVWTADLDSLSARSLPLNSSRREARPTWSPDGTEIAFESRRAGNWDVYVANDDGTNLRAITTNPANDGSAVWRPVPVR